MVFPLQETFLSGFSIGGDDMGEMEDRRLIHEYAANGSEEAFAELVNRHLGLVYSAALRRLSDPGAAEEITQAVFTLLAQKAGTLRADVVLAGWLYQTACFKSAQRQREERRRSRREQEAAAMHELNQSTRDEAAWERIEPLLDEAMRQLDQKDREAVLLRFFQRKRLRDVGTELGIDEDAARKRVSRAVARLRDWFGAKGVAYPAAALTALLSARAAESGPAISAASISAAALQGASVSSALGTSLIGMFVTMKLKTIVIGAGVILAITLITLQSLRPESDSEIVQQEKTPQTIQTAPAPLEFSSQSRPLERRMASSDGTAIDPVVNDALVRLEEALYGPPSVPGVNAARDILSSIPLEQRAAALDLVTNALADSSEHIARRAIDLVPLIWPEGQTALPNLFELIRSKSSEWPGVTSDGLIAATQVRSETDIIPELITVAMQSSEQSRKAFVTQMPLLKSQIPGSETVFASNLAPFLYSPYQEERLAAAQALAQLPGEKDPRVVNELAASLEFDDDVSMALASKSLEVLLKMGREAREAIPALQSLAEQRPGFRDMVAMVLKAVAPDELKGVGVPTPLPPMNAAAEALAIQLEQGNIRIEDAAAALDNPGTSLAAARALAEFGPGAGEALPSLRRAFEAAMSSNSPSAMVYGAAIERLDPEAPKPLLLVTDVVPALYAVDTAAKAANRPEWREGLATLSERVPAGMAFRHEDIRSMARELEKVDPSLRAVFVQKLLEMDPKFEAIVRE